MKVMFVCAAAVATSIAVGAAQERGPQPQPRPEPRATQATAGQPTGSAEFVATAAAAGAVEVAAAKLAATKATNPAVKAFAARMAADHAKANSELEKVATGQSLKMPDTTAAVSRAMAKLQNLSGAEFDKEYMEMQVRAHQDAVTLFEHQSQRGTDASIKAFAQQTLPTLREHQKMAHDAADAAGVKGK